MKIFFVIVGTLLHLSVYAYEAPAPAVYKVLNQFPNIIFNQGISSPGVNDNLQDFADGRSCLANGNQLMNTRFVAGFATIEAAVRTATHFSAEHPHQTIYLYEIYPDSQWYNFGESLHNTYLGRADILALARLYSAQGVLIHYDRVNPAHIRYAVPYQNGLASSRLFNPNFRGAPIINADPIDHIYFPSDMDYNPRNSIFVAPTSTPQPPACTAQSFCTHRPALYASSSTSHLCVESDFKKMSLRHYLAQSLAPILFSSTELNSKVNDSGVYQ